MCLHHKMMSNHLSTAWVFKKDLWRTKHWAFSEDGLSPCSFFCSHLYYCTERYCLCLERRLVVLWPYAFFILLFELVDPFIVVNGFVSLCSSTVDVDLAVQEGQTTVIHPLVAHQSCSLRLNDSSPLLPFSCENAVLLHFWIVTCSNSLQSIKPQ